MLSMCDGSQNKNYRIVTIYGIIEGRISRAGPHAGQGTAFSDFAHLGGYIAL